MSFPSEDQWRTAVMAALTAVNARPYDWGVIPSSTVSAYNSVTVVDRFGGVPNLVGKSGTRGVRIIVRAVGKAIDPANPLGNAREMRRRHDLALREKRLTIGGVTTNPIEFESAEAIGPEDGGQLTTGAWCLGDTFYTCVI